MAKDPQKDENSMNADKGKEFRFASKEGLIIVSLVLFIVYAFWYKIFEFYYSKDFIKWIFIFTAYSLVVFITMSVLLLTGIYVFLKDRKYIITHEKLGAPIFIIGTFILLIIPLGWSFKFIDYQGVLALNSIVIIVIGAVICVIGALILARTGGFFSVWIIGIIIYLIIPLNALIGIFPSQNLGFVDDFFSSIGIYVVVTSFLLFLYHDLKFLYLTRIIKKGNTFRREKKYKEALRCFNRTLKIYPLFTTAWNNMGNVYFNLGKPNDAIKCYKRALTINPNYQNARKNLAVVAKKAR